VGIAIDEYNMFHDWQWNTDGQNKDTITEPYTADDHYNLRDKNHGSEVDDNT
jgi:hypothetical protein